MCIVAAWNETTPTLAATGSSVGCINANGRYLDDADCLVLEAY